MRIKFKPHRLNFISNNIHCYRPGQKIEYRAFKRELYIMTELNKEITITVHGGIIQDISNIPHDVIIRILDYDNDEDDQEYFWE